MHFFIIINMLSIIVLSIFLLNFGDSYWKLSYHDLKAIWYLEAFRDLRIRYPKIRIAVVWSEKWQNSDGTYTDLRIESSPEALDAYRVGIKNKYFLGKNALKFTNYRMDLPDSGCYIGAFAEGGLYEDSVSVGQIKRYEILEGKPLAFVQFSLFWGKREIPLRQLRAIKTYGAIPMIQLLPWGKPYTLFTEQPSYSLDNIIAGKFDKYLIEVAQAIKNYRDPVFITFGVEMNGDWFPWSGIFNGGKVTNQYGDPNFPDGPERYRDAFRHVVNVFRKVGAQNVIWYFHADAISEPDEQWNFIENYYPGDDYVDWVGISAFGPQSTDDSWFNFSEVMDRVYTYLTGFFPDKPLMLAEWGVMEKN